MEESVVGERGGGDDGADVVETSTELEQVAEGDAVVREGDDDASRVGTGPSRGLELGADGGARGTWGRTRGGGERALATTRGRLERGGQASLAAGHGPVEGGAPRDDALGKRPRRPSRLLAPGRPHEGHRFPRATATSPPRAFAMSSRGGGPRSKGTDGSDHQFRQTVDNKYKKAAAARKHLRKSLAMLLAYYPVMTAFAVGPALATGVTLDAHNAPFAAAATLGFVLALISLAQVGAKKLNPGLFGAVTRVRPSPTADRPTRVPPAAPPR